MRTSSAIFALVLAAAILGCRSESETVAPGRSTVSPTSDAAIDRSRSTSPSAPRFLGYPESPDEPPACKEARRGAETSRARGTIRSVSPLEVRPGTNVTVWGDTFPPGSIVNALLAWPGTDSQTNSLGVASVDAAGSFILTFDVPAAIQQSAAAREMSYCLVLSLPAGGDYGAFVVLKYLGP